MQKAIEGIFTVPAEKAEQLMSGVEIIHPYGSPGPLSGDQGVPFGTFAERWDEHSINLFKRATGTLRTFFESPLEMERIHRAFEACGKIVFLGFGYAQQNLELLHPGVTPIRSRSIIGTTLGFAPAAQDSLKTKMRGMFRPPHGPNIEPQLKSCSCKALLDEFSLALVE